MKFRAFILIVYLFSILPCQSRNVENLELWYIRPASKWMESLPIGNGRLGAMIYGRIEEDIIALNESSMWSGEYDVNQEIPLGKEKLNDIRQLFFNGKLKEGNQIASEYLRGTPHSFGTHLPIGDIKLKFAHESLQKIENYRRSLNLNNSVVAVDYTIGDVKYKREYISSNPDDIIAINISADKPKSVSFDVLLSPLQEVSVEIEDNQLIFSGQALFPKQGSGGVFFDGRICVEIENGNIYSKNRIISIKNSDKATIFIDVRTNFKNKNYKELCKSTIENTRTKEFDEIKYAHTRDYKNLFDRVKLSLGKNDDYNLPTDERLKNILNGQIDTGLESLFFQYARYLTIASSRHNSPLPIALQGFFNDNLACNMGWTNDYHLDINTQQNYWLTNLGNLTECNIPLFNYISDLALHGSKTAKTVYGCKGWTAHTTANIWGYTSPSSSIAWGLFPTAASWLASHLWRQYEYTLDKKFLENTAYPLLKSHAEFLLDYLVIDPSSGYLMTGPSISPENSFLYNGMQFHASMMPTCDRVLVYEIFQYCIKASEILKTDNRFADSLRCAVNKLPPFNLRANKALREWYEDYDEAQPNHRHTTHLLAFYPYSQISEKNNPEFIDAVRKTIENRLSAENWEDTEWSRANLICLYARLKDTSRAYNSIQILLKDFIRGNLLAVSPAGIAGAEEDIFIIDGNTAGAAGIGEMLIQNHNGYIEFLPCLPTEWAQGSFEGLCVKGGAEVSANWQNFILKKAQLKISADNIFNIKLPDNKKYSIKIDGKKNNHILSGGIINLNLKKGQIIEITKR